MAARTAPPKPSRYGALVTIAALIVLPAGRAAAATLFPSSAVRVDVTITTDGTARVVERYALDAALGSADLELLDQPCVAVGPIAVRAAGRAVTFDRAESGPWVRLRAPVDLRAGDPLQVEYAVQLGAADAGVPLVVPSAPLGSIPQARGADVDLRVAFGAGLDRASVVLPRFDPATAPRSWGAHMLAVPSVVRVHLPGERGRSCRRTLAGSSGGLEWRFRIFVATMAVWIPIYFWWFARRAATA